MNTTSPMKILGEEDYGKETSDTENENHFKYEKSSEKKDEYSEEDEGLDGD